MGFLQQIQPWGSLARAPLNTNHLTGPSLGLQKTAPSYYEAPHPQPWRQDLGFENVDLSHLPGNQTFSKSLVLPRNGPSGMATEPIKFPNLVATYDRNQGQPGRTALYTRHTPYEWAQSQMVNFNQSDTNRNLAENIRSDAVKLMRLTDETTATGQRETGRRLGERITDTTFWRNELSTELEKLNTETSLLQETKRALDKAIEDCEPPLHIAQECLYHREHRQGIDLVHDQPEQFLLKEVENLKSAQNKLTNLRQTVVDQLRKNRSSQHELETDVRSKESALGIDTACHQLNNYSRGINYFGGIEKYDPTVCVPETWSEHSNRICMRSQGERSRSAQLRTDSDNLINACANDIWNCWNNTNSALARRATETLEAKNKVQMHLHRVQQEIFDVDKSIELLRKAIMDKSNPLKVAQTRLEARAHRRDIEACKDPAHIRLIKEVGDLGESIDSLHRKLQEAENQQQQLLMTRSNLETDLNIKVNSLFIDREKCLSMRKSFPVMMMVKY